MSNINPNHLPNGHATALQGSTVGDMAILYPNTKTDDLCAQALAHHKLVIRVRRDGGAIGETEDVARQNSANSVAELSDDNGLTLAKRRGMIPSPCVCIQ